MSSLSPEQQQQVEQLRRQARFREMILFLEPIVQERPDDAMARGWLAHGLAESGREEEALEHAESALRVDPGCGPAYAAKGRVLWNRGKHQEATDAYKTAVTAAPPFVVAYRYLVGLYFHALKNPEEAAAIVDQANKEHPNHPDAVSARAFLLRRSKKYAEAETLFTQVLMKQADLVYALNQRAQVKESNGDFQGALSDLNQALAINPEYKEALNSRGFLKANKLNDKQGALADYSRLIEVNPDYKYAWANRGAVKADLGDYQGALADYNRALVIDPDYVWVLNKRGDLKRIHLNDVQGALADYNRAVGIDPEYEFAWASRGAAKDESGDYQGALADYNRALVIDPDYVWALYRRGDLKRVHLNDAQGAIADLSRAVEIDPEYEFAWASRGVKNSQLKNYQAAISDLNRALALDKGYAWALEWRAIAYAAAQMPDKALVDRARLYMLEPKQPPQASDAEEKLLFGLTYDHFSKVLLPQIKQSGERFVEYWESLLLWGAKTNQGMYQGTSTYAHFGVAGAGYVCATDKNVRIVSLGQLSKHFVKKRGLFTKLFFAALRNYDFSKREEKDCIWIVPAHTIRGATSAEESIALNTTSENWEILPFYRDDLPIMLTALGLLRSDSLGRLLDEPVAPPAPPPPPKVAASMSQDQIFAAIEKLAKLREMNALTEVEFNAKKKELLDRL